MFTVLNGVLLNPLPYRDANRLVVIWARQIHAKGEGKLFDLYADYENWKNNGKNFEAVAAASWSPQASPLRTLTEHGPARTVFALPVTADFFSLLQVPAILGRTFTVADKDQGCAVVLAYNFWQTSFGARPDAISQAIRLDDQACTILGVMPPSFAFLPPVAKVDMWTIMRSVKQPDEFSVAVFARLRPGVSRERAQAEITALHQSFHAHDRWGALVEPVVYDLHDEFTWLTSRNLRLSLIVLFAAVTVVLLICCLNVANLLLARAVDRQREMAIRAALGAQKGDLLRQLFTEYVLLSAAGAIAGIGLAAVMVYYFRNRHPIEMPPGISLGLNLPVLAFTALLGFMTAAIFGLGPGLKSARVNLNDELKAGSKTQSQTRGQYFFSKGLIVAEITLTVVLLAGAGVLIQSMVRFASAPLGFDQTNLLTASLRLPQGSYAERDHRRQFYERLASVLSEIPEARGVSFSTSPPTITMGSLNVMEVEGHPTPSPESVLDTFQDTVSPDYFQVMGTDVESGRAFLGSDNAQGEPVAIVNEALAHKYFGDEDPVGKHLRPFDPTNPSASWFRVIGIVANERQRIVAQEMAWADVPILYRPLNQNLPDAATLLMRVSKVTNGIAKEIQQQAATVDPNIPIDRVETVSDMQSRTLAYPRFRAVLLAVFAAIALLLAIVGVFGLLSHLVTSRSQEIAIRVALGAQKRTVLTMILKEGLILTASGTVLGAGLAWMLGHYMTTLLYGTKPADPLLLAVIALVVFPTALIAMYLPARRASRIDPIRTLKYE